MAPASRRAAGEVSCGHHRRSWRHDDNGNVIKRTDGISDKFKMFIADNTILMNFIRNVIYTIRERNKTADRQVVNHERSSWTRDAGLWKKYGEPGLESSGHHLDVLWTMLEERGIDMTLVVYPWPDQILNPERECAQVTWWRAWTAARDIDFIDAFPAFLDAGPPEEVVETCFIPMDMHWNERGHALIAEVLLDGLHP